MLSKRGWLGGFRDGERVGYVGVVEAMKATCVGIHYVWPG